MNEKQNTTTIPMPEPGHVWQPASPRSAARKVLKVERWKYRVAVFLEGRGAHSLGEFHAWARRTKARPV